MNNSIVSIRHISQLHLNHVHQQQKQRLALAGFSVVIAAMQVADEGLFTFKDDPNQCLYFKSVHCTGLRSKAVAYVKVNGEWVPSGTHIFNHHGISETISVNWDDVIICE